jgi:hypothetical protein
LAADSTVDIAAAVKLRGSGGEFALSPATPTRAMVIGDLASDPGALRMLARGGFDSALDGFSALGIGSDQQQGSITMGQSGTGLSFADPVVVRVKPDAAVPVRLQNEIRGVSLTIGTGSVVVSSGPLLGFTDRIEFGGTLQVAGSTTLQARTIDFRGGAGSVTAPTSATLTLQPDTKTGAIRLGGNEAAGTFVLDTDSIAALAAGGGRVVVGYDASAGNGGGGGGGGVGGRSSTAAAAASEQPVQHQEEQLARRLVGSGVVVGLAACLQNSGLVDTASRGGGHNSCCRRNKAGEV